MWSFFVEDILDCCCTIYQHSSHFPLNYSINTAKLSDLNTCCGHFLLLFTVRSKMRAGYVGWKLYGVWTNLKLFCDFIAAIEVKRLCNL